MIHVVLAAPADVESDAILRSISSDREADTGFSRELGLLAGSGVSQRLQAMGELPVGAAVLTPAGDLPVGFLIHVVLQSAEEPVTAQSLRSALQNGLRRAEEWEMEKLALPPLGTGAGKMDADESASVMVPLIWDHIRNSGSLREVLIVVETAYEKDVFHQAIEAVQRQIPVQGS